MTQILQTSHRVGWRGVRGFSECFPFFLLAPRQFSNDPDDWFSIKHGVITSSGGEEHVDRDRVYGFKLKP